MFPISQNITAKLRHLVLIIRCAIMKQCKPTCRRMLTILADPIVRITSTCMIITFARNTRRICGSIRHCTRVTRAASFTRQSRISYWTRTIFYVTRRINSHNCIGTIFHPYVAESSELPNSLSI